MFDIYYWTQETPSRLAYGTSTVPIDASGPRTEITKEEHSAMVAADEAESTKRLSALVLEDA